MIRSDMASAEGILTVMQEGGIQPSSETYALLMCGYIRNGNLEKVEELFKKCELMEIMFSDNNYFDVIYEYTLHGYDDQVDQVILSALPRLKIFLELRSTTLATKKISNIDKN